MDIGALLTRKIGPLQVWVYGAIIVVAAWGYYYFNGKTPTVPGATLPTPDASSAELPDVPGSSIGDGSGGLNATSGPTAPSSNQGWYQRATDYLLGFGYEGVAVANALTKYLQGEQLTIPERALVNQAISRFGAPPEGAPVTPGGNPTTPTIPQMPGGESRDGTPVPRRVPRWTPPLIPSPGIPRRL